MSRRDPVIILQQILSHAEEAVALAQGKTRADLDTDRMLNLALTRLLEIVGEAAGRMPPEERKNYSHIPWSPMVSLRNRLIHGYDVVDYDILWSVVGSELPPLIVTLKAILATKTLPDANH